MAHAVQHLEIEAGVALGGRASEGDAHEAVLLTVDEQRRAAPHGCGEVAVGGTARELAQERSCRVGVRTRRLGVGEPLGGQLHEPTPHDRVETGGVGEAQLERLVGDSLGAQHPRTRGDRVSCERRHHERRQPRRPPPVGRTDAGPGQRRVDEHETND